MIRRAVGAHYGATEWAAQLLTAAVMVVCTDYLIIAWIVVGPDSHAELAAFVRSDSVRLPLMLMVVALVWHAWIGGKSIMMDYLRHDWFRLLKITALACWLVVCLAWAAGVLWGSSA